MLHESGNFFDGHAFANVIARSAHALRKIEPHLAVGTALRIAVKPFFVGEVLDHGPTKFAIAQAAVEGRKIRWKCSDVMIVVAGILAEIVARKFAFTPRLVERMTKQIVLG